MLCHVMHLSHFPTQTPQAHHVVSTALPSSTGSPPSRTRRGQNQPTTSTRQLLSVDLSHNVSWVDQAPFAGPLLQNTACCHKADAWVQAAAAQAPSPTSAQRPNGKMGTRVPAAAVNGHAVSSPAISIQELGFEVLQEFDRRWAAQKQASSGKAVRKASTSALAFVLSQRTHCPRHDKCCTS
jgi:hypothetical protein